MKHTYDWQSEPEGFWKWFLPVMAESFDIDDMSNKTDKFTKIDVTMQVNGVDVDPAIFVKRFKEQYDWQVEQTVAEKIEQADLTDIYETINKVRRAIRKEIVGRFDAIGIDISDDEDY